MTGRRVALVAAVALAVSTVVPAGAPALSAPAAETRAAETRAVGAQAVAPALHGCDDRLTTRVVGTIPDEFHAEEPQDARTYDLRDARSIAVPFASTEAFVIGAKLQQQARHLCVLGGTVRSSPVVRDWPRQYVKQKFAGHALYAEGTEEHPLVMDGLRVDGAEDGLGPLGNGWVLRNAYIGNIRDDCVENDFLSAGLIEDTLFDGCYMGLSVEPTSWLKPSLPTAGGDPVVLDDVLMRLKPLPDPIVARAPDGVTHNRLWKFALNIPPILVRDSVLLVEEAGAGRRQTWPANLEAENVTVVWLGAGDFLGTVPAGVTVTTDAGVWEQARTAWLTEHGYPLLPDWPGLTRTAVTGDGFVTLAWKYPSGATSVRIKRSESPGGPFTTVGEVAASVPRTFTDTDVDNGTRYHYVATSVNAHGESEVSNEVVAVPVADGAAAPAAPQNLVATPDVDVIGHHNGDTGRIELTWNHAANAEDYVVFRGEQPGVYTFQAIVRENSYLDVGRPIDVPIYYQVVARNRHGSSPPTPEASAVTDSAPQVLARPRFRPPVAGDGQLELRWLSDPVVAGTVYTVKRSTQPGGPYQPIADVVDDAVYVDTGLQNGTTYYYVVEQNDDTTPIPDSEEVFETPQAGPVLPAGVTGVTAGAANSGVQLAWDQASLATHYTVTRAASPAGPFEPLYKLVRGTSFTDYGVQSNQSYSYQIIAHNSFGDSAPSATVTRAVGALDHTPPTVTVTGVTDGATYEVGAQPTPGFTASDGGGVAFQDDVLHTPGTGSKAGQYTYVVTVRDNAGNETIAYTTYHVVENFGGFQAPLDQRGTTMPPDLAIPVTFELTNATGGAVTGARFTLLVDGAPATAWAPKQPSQFGGTYKYLLDPRPLSAGLHTLTVVLDDGTRHETTFRLAAS